MCIRDSSYVAQSSTQSDGTPSTEFEAVLRPTTNVWHQMWVSAAPAGLSLIHIYEPTRLALI
eukprot:6158443-Alexandrium_andersonii.AAC.1